MLSDIGPMTLQAARGIHGVIFAELPEVMNLHKSLLAYNLRRNHQVDLVVSSAGSTARCSRELRQAASLPVAREPQLRDPRR
jgi:hypothetical protein